MTRKIKLGDCEPKEKRAAPCVQPTHFQVSFEWARSRKKKPAADDETATSGHMATQKVDVMRYQHFLACFAPCSSCARLAPLAIVVHPHTFYAVANFIWQKLDPTLQLKSDNGKRRRHQHILSKMGCRWARLPTGNTSSTDVTSLQVQHVPLPTSALPGRHEPPGCMT